MTIGTTMTTTVNRVGATMALERRRSRVRLVALLAAGAAGWAGSRPVRAQGVWPVRPIRLIVPFPPGVGVDVAVRTIAPKLGERLGQPVVVENRPGAGGNIGIEAAVRAPADGYTLLGTSSNFTANPSLYGKVGYDPLRDFVPVVGLIRTPAVLVVAAESPYRTVDALLAAARARPGAMSYASGGNGSIAHFAGELLKGAAAIDAVHVPYKGAPDIVTSLLSDQTQFALPVLVSALAQIRGGRLRALAVTGRRRSPFLPEVPTMYESLKTGFDIDSDNGLAAPAGTPAEVVARLNAEVVAIMRDRAVVEPLVGGGFELIAGSSAEYGETLRAEVAKYAELVRRTGARID